MPRMQYPYMASVNEQAIKILLAAGTTLKKALTPGGDELDILMRSIDQVNSDLDWSKKHRCPSCAGAGMGNDGDTWDQSDICSSCKGTGIKGDD